MTSMPKKKILLIDDEREMVEMLVMRLSSHGYEVVTAYDGPSGLSAARREVPDLIVLDVMLPQMGGDRVCRELKSGQETALIPVIVLTAKQEVGEESYRQWGADDFVIKPGEPEELLSKIRKWIKKRNGGV